MPEDQLHLPLTETETNQNQSNIQNQDLYTHSQGKTSTNSYYESQNSPKEYKSENILQKEFSIYLKD